MKNLLTAALAALLCSCGGANYTITGRYELPPGDSVYLLASDNTVLAAGVVNADTTVSLQGTVTTRDLVFLANAKRTNHPAWFFLEPGKIRIEKYKIIHICDLDIVRLPVYNYTDSVWRKDG